MIVKNHITHDGRSLLCVTDKDLLGQKFEENDRQLDFSTGFYSGTEKSRDEVSTAVSRAYLVIFSGKDSIALGKQLSMVDEKSILLVKGVPQAQCLNG